MSDELTLPQINVTRSSMPPLEEFVDEIRGIWSSHWLTNMGEKHEEFRRQLCKFLGVEHVTLYTNGHLALEGVLAAMKFPRGGEVITTPFTFASTTHAIVRSGLVPVFCDVNPRDYTIDAGLIEPLITDRTVAILPVHVYGNLCDVGKIADIARRHSLKVIYDAAHAFGATLDGKSAAAFGDAAMFSFHATKVFNTIEGGAVCYRDGALEQTLDDLKNFGIHSAEEVPFVGGNAKMSEFQAAMGICNLRHLPGEIAKRGRAAALYRKLLADVPGVTLPEPQPGVSPNYAYFPAVFSSQNARDAACDRLKAHNIIARKYFYPLTNDFECYGDLPTAGGWKTPVARDIASRVLTLPLYADLADSDVERVCGIIAGE